jgi:hypothetical protein
MLPRAPRPSRNARRKAAPIYEEHRKRSDGHAEQSLSSRLFALSSKKWADPENRAALDLADSETEELVERRQVVSPAGDQ